MSPTQTGAGASRWIHAWLLLIASVWALGLRDAVVMLRWAGTTPEMCEGFPDYAGVGGLLPAKTPVGFLSEQPEPARSERFYCAQLDLAPRVLFRWRGQVPRPAPQQLQGSTLLLDFADHDALEAFLRELAAEVERQGAAVERRNAAGGLTVVTVAEGGNS